MKIRIINKKMIKILINFFKYDKNEFNLKYNYFNYNLFFKKINKYIFINKILK